MPRRRVLAMIACFEFLCRHCRGSPDNNLGDLPIFKYLVSVGLKYICLFMAQS